MAKKKNPTKRYKVKSFFTYKNKKYNEGDAIWLTEAQEIVFNNNNLIYKK